VELKPGYKKTEVGVIPEDWEVRSLRDVVDFTNGKPHETNVKTNGRYFLITLDSIGIDGNLKTEHKQTDVLDCSLQKNDIVAVLSDIAHGNLLGLCDLIPEDDKYVLNQRMGRLRIKVTAVPQFVRLQINRRQDHFKKRGQGTSQRHIYRRDVDSLAIPFPPENEQRIIARALSDVDALINGLDSALAKKRDLKQAAMQQLLTGQIRLPGFHGEWEVKRLGDVASISRGASPRPIDSPIWFDENSEIGWVRISDVTRSEIFLRETTQHLSPIGIKNSRPVSRGRLIMSICATVGRPIITEIDTCIHDGFVVFDAPRLNQRFLYYTLKFIEDDWSKHGQTGSQMNLNTGLINRTKISVPSAKEEQTAIAEVLSDMDAELAALEQRRDKTRVLKQGMMQELLTGKTRLV
jgi:type I restriction enzyme S subunit